MVRRFSVMALSLWICALAFLPHGAETAHAKAPGIFAVSSKGDGGDLDTPKPRNGDEFFAFMISTASASAGQFLTPEQIKQMLRAEAERPITFLNDGKARINAPDEPASFAVFEDGRWKIDDTETAKSELLSLEKFPFMDF